MAAEQIAGFVPIDEPRKANLKGLELLRAPFPPHQISKLPKGTKAQNECPPSEKKNCSVCGGWHHPKVVHLDYVGHAALTDRLLDADPNWSWSPLSFDEDGLPRFDKSGGLWIKLTVCGVTRLGYGHAANKGHMDIGSREKEVIGDALRNAAMRFGAALDLWHKGELHAQDTPEPAREPVNQQGNAEPEAPEEVSPQHAKAAEYLARFGLCKTTEEVTALSKEIKANWQSVKGLPGFSEQLVKARAKAFERCQERQPGEEG